MNTREIASKIDAGVSHMTIFCASKNTGNLEWSKRTRSLALNKKTKTHG